MGKICCFTGHREINDNEAELAKMLKQELVLLIDEGFDTFRAGGALGFDMLAADVVLSLKKHYPEIKLEIFVPCLTQNKYYTAEQNRRYLDQINAADRRVCFSKEYFRGCMQVRNRGLVDGADICIAYLRKTSGGTAYTVNYAKNNQVKVIEL